MQVRPGRARICTGARELCVRLWVGEHLLGIVSGAAPNHAVEPPS